jgi:D-alanine-D-alanine ligase-like ATP-grasp enzyme
MSKEREVLFKVHISFCNKVFTKSTEISCLHHAIEEICEVWKEKDSEKKIEEYVDVIMCLLHGLNKAGFTVDQFKEVFARKLTVNSLREWKQNEDGSYSHVKQIQ